MKHLLLTTIAAVVLVGCGEYSQRFSSNSLILKILSILWAVIVLLAFAIVGIYIFILIIRSLKGKLKETLTKSLRKSCQNGDFEDVRRRLAEGENVNSKEGDETTPLHYAPTKKIAELLIKNGAYLNAKNHLGWTPLHRAAWDSHNDIVELLITAGADVNAKDEGGFTPLHSGATNGRKEVTELLIAEGADVNAKNRGGYTPLHFAAEGGHDEIAELLIATGSNVNAKQEDGETPLDVAIKFDETDTVDLLRKHGGKTGEELKAEGK